MLVTKTTASIAALVVIWPTLMAFLPVQSMGGFHLKSTECSVSGTEGSGVVTINGVSWYAMCIPGEGIVTIKSFELDTNKLIDESEFEYLRLEDIGIANSKSGNVKYLFDFANNTFYFGQVNIVLDKELIMTKICVGEIY